MLFYSIFVYVYSILSDLSLWTNTKAFAFFFLEIDEYVLLLY